MKTATLKVTALVPGILLVLISLYLNFAWHAELWEYRAAAASSSGVASRPVLFSKVGASLTVACTYDYMGRRATKVVTENGVVTTSHRFLYRGYLQNVVNARKIS